MTWGWLQFQKRVHFTSLRFTSLLGFVTRSRVGVRVGAYLMQRAQYEVTANG